MKRFLLAIVACLMLCGCGREVPETTAPTRPQETVAPTEPAGSYLPDSKIEQASNGAVRSYPQHTESIRAIRVMGEKLLVFSGNETTTLTLLTGENLCHVAEIQLDIVLTAQAPSLYVSEGLVVYYNPHTREMVYLNENLREISRMTVPADILGEPVLTEDRSVMYYCAASGVYCLEVETGISRLVKEMTFAEQYLTDILMGDTVLRIDTVDENGNRETLFLDAQTGALLGSLPEDMTLSGGTDYVYAMDPEGAVTQMIYAGRESVGLLTPKHYLDCGIFLPEVHAAAVRTREGMLDYYDLSTGKRTASLDLGDIQPESMTVSDNGYLYFLSDSATICRWDISASATDDETIYTGTRYTMDAPDQDGLGKCRIYARQLGEEHGLDIQIVTGAVNFQPFDYDLIPEYQVRVFMDGLNTLDRILDNYPEGFFEAAVEGMEAGKLTVCLVRGLVGSPEAGSLDTADGIQYWNGNHAYVAIALGESFERTFYHEMFHVLETRVLSESIAYYRWDELNPKGFDYDYDYITNQSRDGSAYLEEKSRAFIDTYSMSFPKEDRARIMEYACMDGNEHYFISYTMQRKLRTLCQGIREAYGLENSTEIFLWEQYLESPLAPQA